MAEARGIILVETVIQDLRYAFRGVVRTPVFAFTAILTLGFGIAAVSTVLTLANTLFFRELPVHRADRLVVVQPTRQHGQMPGWVAYPDYVHFRDHTKTLEALAAAYSTAPLFVNVDQRSQEINGAVVSANYFPLLGVRPALGRFFDLHEDAVPDRDRVAVVSFEFWRNWLGSSAAALGSIVKINGTAFTIIGVAPQGFGGVTVQPDQIFIPTMMARAGYRWCENALGSYCTTFDMIGRLRDGQNVEQARAEIATLMPEAWAKAKRGENSGLNSFLLRGVMHPDLTRNSELRFITLLSCVAAVLLLVCCVNLAGLLVARNGARIREIAIRTSLGAGRLRLTRQFITESLVLAAGGGAVGCLLSVGLTGALNVMFYSNDIEGHPLYYNFDLEPGIVAAVLAISLVAGCVLASFPALYSTRGETAERLKRRSAGAAADSRSGRWLAGVQAGIAMGLAAVAGLLVSSAHHWMTGANFDTSHVALMRLRPNLINYPPDKAQNYLRRVIERLNSMPGVVSASMVAPGAVLFGGSSRVALPGVSDDHAIESGYIEVGPRYFETVQTPVLRGREFNQHDNVHSSPVAIVSETLARQFWPDGKVVGSTIVVDKQPRQIVGVVEDVPWQTRGEPQRPYVYIPFWQNARQVDTRVCVRVRSGPAAMLPELVRQANGVDPAVPIAETIPLSVQVTAGLSPLRITATFASYAAVLAVLLSGLGLYGVLAFSIARRTKEIGIRMAIGAKSTEVLGSVMRDGMTVILLGIVSGFVLGIGGSNIIRHLLYASNADDVRVYGAAGLIVATIGLFASWIPARRAARLDPIAALRDE